MSRILELMDLVTSLKSDDTPGSKIVVVVM